MILTRPICWLRYTITTRNYHNAKSVREREPKRLCLRICFLADPCCVWAYPTGVPYNTHHGLPMMKPIKITEEVPIVGRATRVDDF